jgi:hypothetical protein
MGRCSFVLNTYRDHSIITSFGFEKGGYIELTSHITLADGSTRCGQDGALQLLPMHCLASALCGPGCQLHSADTEPTQHGGRI